MTNQGVRLRGVSSSCLLSQRCHFGAFGMYKDQRWMRRSRSKCLGLVWIFRASKVAFFQNAAWWELEVTEWAMCLSLACQLFAKLFVCCITPFVYWLIIRLCIVYQFLCQLFFNLFHKCCWVRVLYGLSVCLLIVCQIGFQVCIKSCVKYLSIHSLIIDQFLCQLCLNSWVNRLSILWSIVC